MGIKLRVRNAQDDALVSSPSDCAGVPAACFHVLEGKCKTLGAGRTGGAVENGDDHGTGDVAVRVEDVLILLADAVHQTLMEGIDDTGTVPGFLLQVCIGGVEGAVAVGNIRGRRNIIGILHTAVDADTAGEAVAQSIGKVAAVGVATLAAGVEGITRLRAGGADLGVHIGMAAGGRRLGWLDGCGRFCRNGGIGGIGRLRGLRTSLIQDVELEAEVLLGALAGARVIGGERGLVSVPFQIDIAIAAGQLSAVDPEQLVGGVGGLYSPTALAGAVQIEVIIGFAVALGRSDAEGRAALSEFVAAIGIFGGGPNDGSVAGNDLVVGGGHIRAGNIVTGHFAHHSFAVALIIEDDFRTAGQAVRQDILIAGHRLGGRGRLGRTVGIGGGDVTFRNACAQQQEGQLGIVHKDVAHAGDGLDSVIAAQLPGIYRIFLHPFQEDSSALHDAAGAEQAGVAPADHVLEHQAGDIAVEIIFSVGFTVGIVVAAALTIGGVAATVVLGFSSGTEHHDVVLISASEALAFGPGVLTVPSIASIPIRSDGDTRVEGRD